MNQILLQTLSFGLLVVFTFIKTSISVANPGWINVQNEGVVANVETAQNDRIQHLIDRTSEQGGGTIYFSSGDYIIGTIYLKDNVTLYLEQNANLLGSDRIEDYKPKGMVVADHAENIAILGAINGRNHLWWTHKDNWENHPRRLFSWVPHHVHGHPNPSPGTMVKLWGCKNVTIRDVTLKDSENWNLHILGCQDVTIDGIRIQSDLLGANSDGIDIESSQDVTISNCEVYCGDDAICLKNRNDDFNHLPCKNITVTNCIITTTCNGFKIGTGTHGDFENITFSNSVIKAALPDEPLAKGAAKTLHPDLFDNGLAPLSGIALESVDGGHVRGIRISNIVMKGVRAPIFIRLGNRGGRGGQRVENPTPGSLSDLNLSNITAYEAQIASSISGIPGHPVQSVSLDNILIYTDGSGTQELAQKELPEKIDGYPEATTWGPMPVYGLYCRHVDGLYLNDIRILANGPDQRPAPIV